MKIDNFTYKIRSGFSLVELLVVVVIIGILSSVSYVAIQGAKRKALNERMLDDLIMIANSLEDFRRDHDGSFPVPDPDGNQNIICYYEDSTYAHDCDEAAFRQGMIDNSLLSRKYLRTVPTDPRTDSRYVYGVTNDGLFFQVAGNYEAEDGVFEARLAGNLEKGFYLPSIIRAFDGPNFVVEKGTYLPYSDNHLVLTGKLENINGQVDVEKTAGTDTGVSNGYTVREGYIIKTAVGASADIYFSDGSFTHVDPESKLELKSLRVERNDSKETTTKILLKLDLGKIWSKVVRLAKKSEFRVETTNSIAGVRGTEFGTEVDSDGNLKELILLAGEIEVDGKSFVVERTGDKPRIPKRITYKPTGEIEKEEEIKTPEAVAVLVGQYYEDVLLTSNMQPHILTIDGAHVTVRNVNHLVDLVSGRAGFDRHVKVSRLAVYSDEELTQFMRDSGDISTEYSEPYIFIVSLNKPLFLRFEELNDAGEVVNASSVSKLSAILQTTQLNQYDLYPRQFEERPVLKITVPRRYSLNSSGSVANQFPVRVTVKDVTLTADEEIIYGITAEASTGICEPQQAASSLQTSSLTHDFRVDALGEGECKLIVMALLPNGARLSKNMTVQVEIAAVDSEVVSGVKCDGFQKDGVEDCDGEDLGGATCESEGFDGGTLGCSNVCSFDTSGCQRCGDGVREGDEVCDGGDLGEATCKSQMTDGAGYTGLSCASDCSAFDTTSCTTTVMPPVCGDGKVEGREVCDEGAANSDVYDSTCNTSCTGSGSYCGDGITDAGYEECDGNDFGGASLACAAAVCNVCVIDESNCKTFAVVTSQSFYQVNTDYPLDIVGYASITVLPSTTTNTLNATDKTFNATSPGVYTITGTDSAGQSASIALTVCGYVGDGSECWVMGGEGESCEVGCNLLDGSITGQGIDCDTSNNWNDVGGVVCSAITGEKYIGNAEFAYAPYYKITRTQCYDRIEPYDYFPPITLCNSISDPGLNRICRCE